MPTIENDKRKQANTINAGNDDDNNKKDGPPGLNTDFFPEKPGDSGGGGGTPPDLNTAFFEDGNPPIDREEVKKSGEYNDLIDAYGYSEPPSFEDRSAQTDQTIAEGNADDASSIQDGGSDKTETSLFSQTDANQTESPDYASRSEQTDEAISRDNQSGDSVDSPPDKSADSAVESNTEAASEPIAPTSNGPDKPYS